MALGVSQAIPAAVAERTRNSRRCMGDLLMIILRVHQAGRASKGGLKPGSLFSGHRGPEGPLFHGGVEAILASSNAERSGQQAEGQGDGQEYDFEDAMDGDADDAEGKQDQPDEGIGDQGHKCERPAEDEEDAPEQECEHGDLLFFF
jgi:hypothetical protein